MTHFMTHFPFLLVGPEIHNSTYSFLFYDILNFVYNIFFLNQCFQVTCSVRGRGFRPGGYSHTLPILVCAAQRGRDFEASELERGIHFRGVF